MNMKRQVEFLAILFSIALSSLSVAYRIVPCYGATYVEGLIVQDTEWTLVDSPFVLSNNLTIMSGVTLTLEPGVEVRFGGDFSLFVEGRIVAIGTSDRKILFTSNDLEGNTTWGTILINGLQQSTFADCIIEYGTDGITCEDGFLEIESSFIQSNSENGIVINNGTVTVRNNEIAWNEKCGIYIAGGAQVTIENNVIQSNEDGIFLTGILARAVSARQNTILNNTRSGITVESDFCDTTSITSNRIIANDNGFLVRTNTSTYITRNFISNNTIGIYYEFGNNHEAHFNDFYDNVLGMDVSLESNVIATHNYWGHRSGPFHASMNPFGKGNAVGGDGANLDFIFFLTESESHQNEMPTPVLWTDRMLIAPNQDVTLIGTDSYDEGRVDQYLFDFGDGASTGWTTLSLFSHTYSSTGMYTASLRVIDDFNTISDNVATWTITVQDLPTLSASITLGSDSIKSNENVPVTVYVSNEMGGAENAQVTMFSLRGGSFSSSSGITNSTGYFDTIFTAPNVVDMSDIRIIARAQMDGYADGSDYKYVKVLPYLTIRMTSDPAIIRSEETAMMTVSVTDCLEQPVADAYVTLTSDEGSFATNMGFTGSDGIAAFNFTAPYTQTEMNVTITATALKTLGVTQHGYVSGENIATVVIRPKILAVEITTGALSIISNNDLAVTVHVTCDSTPVADAQVIMSADSGSFSSPIGFTNSNGNCVFTFKAPATTVQHSATLTANVSKNGYVNAENQIMVDVIPEAVAGEGFPVLTLLLIIIPIAIAIVIVALIKMKVIVISVKEEEET